MIGFITKGGISALLAICFAAVAYNLDAGWARDTWWFITGMNVGLAFAALFHDRFYASQRRKMREEMHAIGADVVRRMREMHEQHMQSQGRRERAMSEPLCHMRKGKCGFPWCRECPREPAGAQPAT
jgi:hypothetical protein